MWGNDFIFMDGFANVSAGWTTPPLESELIATPWGSGFNGARQLYKRFYDPITSNEFWFGAHIKPYNITGGGGSGASNISVVKFQSDYAYTANSFPISNPMYLEAGIGPTGALRVDYLASRQLFASTGYMPGSTHFEAGVWNHFMVGVRVLPIIIDDVRLMKFYSWIYKNNQLVFEDESNYLEPYNGFANIYSLLKWDGIYLNQSYKYQYANLWISQSGPKGDLIVNN